jgi:hypothetical protein
MASARQGRPPIASRFEIGNIARCRSDTGAGDKAVGDINSAVEMTAAQNVAVMPPPSAVCSLRSVFTGGGSRESMRLTGTTRWWEVNR